MKSGPPPIFPLAPFLLGLAAADIHVTLDDVRRVQRVLETDTDWTHERLRQVLIALLVKNEQQGEDVERLYQQFQQAEGRRTASQIVDASSLQRDLQQLLVQFGQQQEQPPQHINKQLGKPAGVGKRFWWVLTLSVVLAFIGTFILFRGLNTVGSNKFVLGAASSDLLASDSQSTSAISPSVNDSNVSSSTEAAQQAGQEKKQETPASAASVEIKTGNATGIQLSESKQLEVVNTVGVAQEKLSEPTLPVVQPDIYQTSSFFRWDILPWWLAALLSALATLSLWWRLRKSRQMPELPPALNWQLDDQVYFDPTSVGKPMPAWLSDAILDECAESIGFFVAEDESSLLDIPATIKASAQMAGLPEVRMLQQRSLFNILVLVNVTEPSRSWCPIAYELVAGLRQRGLPVILGYLHGNLREFRTDAGELILFETLAEDRGHYVTLIFADVQIVDWQQDKLLLEELTFWPQLAWLTLSEQRFWNGCEQRLQTMGIRLWAVEPTKLVTIFHELSRETRQPHSLQFPYQRFMRQGENEPLVGYIQRLLGDTLPLARIVAVLPPPVSPVLLVRLLREFAPNLPLTRLQRLYVLPSTEVDRVNLSWRVDILRLLRGQFHQWYCGVDKQNVRNFLLMWYQAAKPNNTTSICYYSWYWHYLRLLLEFSPKDAILEMERLYEWINPLRRQIERDLRQNILPIPYPDTDDDESRKRLWRLSTGIAIGEEDVWPKIKKQKQFIIRLILLTVWLAIAVWLKISDGDARELYSPLSKEESIYSANERYIRILQVENEKLRTLLSEVQNNGEYSFVLAEALEVSNDRIRGLVLLDKGSRDGVYEGQPVLAAGGIYGQVIEVTPFSSKVMQLIDKNHSIPVRNQRTGERGLANGNGRGKPLGIDSLPTDSDVKNGDIFVSSGLGGLFPPDFHVARVSPNGVEINRGGLFTIVRAIPAVDYEMTQEILLLWESKGVTK